MAVAAIPGAVGAWRLIMNMRLGAIARRLLTPVYPCDRCGARAYQQIVLTGGGDLYLCELHVRLYSSILETSKISVRQLPH